MSHNCSCHNDHGHCNHESSHDNYFYGYNGGYSFSESDGTFAGILFLIFGIICIFASL